MHIDTDKLIKNCAKMLKNMPAIPKVRFGTQTADSISSTRRFTK